MKLPAKFNLISFKVAKDFINETYKSGDFANTENTLDFITRSISDIEKFIPQELSSDMSGIDMQSVNPDDIKKIKQVTDSMKLSKNKKLAEFVEKLDSLSNQGLNVYSISYNLNNLGVDTINFSEIINSINSDPALRQKTINSIEQDLKKAGLSAKDVNKVKDEINKITYIIKRLFIEVSVIWTFDVLFDQVKNPPFHVEVNTKLFQEKYFTVALFSLLYKPA